MSWLVMLLAGASSMTMSSAHAQLLSGVARFVDIVELTDHDDQADVVVAFNCSLRYQSHMPASEGRELRIQLLPQADCRVAPGAQIAGEFPPVSGGDNIIQSVRVEGDVPGQLTLVLNWQKSEHFVVVQGIDPHSMRIRLLDRARGHGKVMVNEPLDVNTRYAVNLDSQPAPFSDEALAHATQMLNAPAYVATADVDGVTWYRLRVGPIAKRADAEQLVKTALPDYPRAWLAIEDDAMGTGAAIEEGLPAVQRIASDPPLADTERKQLLNDARRALTKRDYATAITLLTRLQRQPEFAERAEAQELLGLARERAGQLAHAKAEYEEYLRRYPQGEAVERVRLRLRTLREASLKERTGGGGQAGEQGWKFSGGFGQTYRHDNSKVNSSATDVTANQGASTNTSAQNGLMSDVDFLARRRGEVMDLTARVSAGYSRTSASGGASGGSSGTSGSASNSANLTRLSVASIELVSRNLGLLARAGRQAQNTGGILGSFDGAFVSWNWVPSWGIQVAAGYPVELTTATIQTRRSFTSAALAYTPPGARWDANIYVARQQFDGVTDRQAIGSEVRYLGSMGSLVALLDYDTYFQSLNTAALLGTWQLPARWNLSFDAEKRNAPVITTRNALIGQPVTTIAEMRQTFFVDEIHQFAIDRTPVTSQYSVTLTRPLAERFQFSATVASSSTGATPASGGVDAQPATGSNLSYQTQLYGSNIFVTGDFSVLSAMYSNTEVGKLTSLGMLTRFPMAGAWRLGPRLTLNRRTLSDQSTENDLVPSILLDYLRGRTQFQFEGGGQIGKRNADTQQQKTTRYYVSASYRVSFQ